MPRQISRKLKTVGLVASVLVLLTAAALRFPVPARAASEENRGASSDKPRLFELRTYTANPGKLDALNKRFREHTNDLFRKHGMTIVGFWTPTEGPRSQDTLIYILAYPDKESREKAWKAFHDDPDWVKAKAESEKDGPLLAHEPESVFMAPTDYSPIR